MLFPNKKYAVMTIDPPWPFRTYGGKSTVPTQGEQPYETMSMAEIAALPIAEHLLPNAAVVLWENDSIPDTYLFLAKAWGLRVATKQLLIWDKGEKMGMGYYTRKQGEVCHLLTNGTPKRLSKAVRQIIREPRRQHSRKPEGFYANVEALFAGPYLDVFGRCSRAGWDVCGNEATKFDSAAAFDLDLDSVENFDL